MVGVVIPTRDRREMVAEAVVSVLRQTRKPDEIVVVDDGSADGTAEHLRREFGDAIRVVSTPPRGVAAARNLGVRSVRSRWVAFLDSDDLWLPRKLERQLEYLDRHPELRACQTEEIWYRNGVRVEPRKYHAKPDGDIFFPSLHRCLVSPSAVLLDRALFERLGGFDESLPACEDYDLWLRLGCEERLGLVREPLVVKRGGHPDQLSRRFWGMDRFRVVALLKLLLREPPLPPAHRRAVREVLERKCGILAAGAEKRGRVEEAERYRALARLGAARVSEAGEGAGEALLSGTG
ncbi:MAG: glycosyl transferase [Candidatus Binatia bacterium]|nr:MAG: glycosyl transferase [Candidatus Binatia bacterium]